MAFSKIILNGTTQMDVTETTAVPGDVKYPKIFTKADGLQSTGTDSGFTYIAEDTTYESVLLGNTTDNEAIGQYSIAEGNGTTASGAYSHSEGYQTLASTETAHAEGYGTTAAGLYSHAEGRNNIASANQAHVGGYGSTAAAVNNFVHGSYLVSSKDNQSVLGQYNAQDSNALFIVGNGTSTASADRSNAFIVNQSGRVTAGANAVGLKDLVTLDQLVPVGSIIRNNISDANVMNTLYPNMTWVNKYSLFNGEQDWPSSDNISGSYKEIIVPAFMGAAGTGTSNGLNFTITIPGLKDSGITINDLDVWAEGNAGVIGRFIESKRYYIYKKKSGVVSFTIKYVDGDNVGLCTGSTANFVITNNTSGSGTAVTNHVGGTCWFYDGTNNPSIKFEISSSYDLGMYIWKRTN